MPLTHTAALLTISTPHFDRLIAFYQRLLDQEPVAVIPNIYAEFLLPGVKLGIFSPKASNSDLEGFENLRGLTTGMSLCLEVENLEHAIAHLSDFGYPPPGPIITASHGREIYAFDPDGNWLILHESRPSQS